MKLEELKDLILNNRKDELKDRLFIFVCEDNFFIAEQYINKLQELLELPIVYKDTLISSHILFNDVETGLLVKKCDEFNEPEENTTLKNTIIVCKKCNDKLFNEYVIKIPKLTTTQVENYVKYQLKGVKDNDFCLWLCKICNYDLYRLQNEIDKITIFQEVIQSDVVDLLLDNDAYYDLASSTKYDFINSVIHNDKDKAFKLVDDLIKLNISPMETLITLVRQFKNVIDVQMSKNPSPEKLGLSSKQFYAVQHNCNYFTSEQLINIFTQLTEIDYLLKSGKISIDRIIDYILLIIFQKEV